VPLVLVGLPTDRRLIALTVDGGVYDGLGYALRVEAGRRLAGREVLERGDMLLHDRRAAPTDVELVAHWPIPPNVVVVQSASADVRPRFLVVGPGFGAVRSAAAIKRVAGPTHSGAPPLARLG
jgi:hypothetical protein